MIKEDFSDEVDYNEYEEAYTKHRPPLIIPKRYDVEDVDLTTLKRAFEWQITYKFTDEIRNNKFPGGKYGSNDMTFRRLYEILCKSFNDGRYFIEDYFKHDFPERPIKEETDSFLYDVNKEIADEYNDIILRAPRTKSGRLDKRYKAFKKLSAYKVMFDDEVKVAGDLLAEQVKLDIKECISTGIITLSKRMLAPSTREKRMKLGFPSDTKFFASGQLIDNMEIYFKLEKTDYWLRDRSLQE